MTSIKSLPTQGEEQNYYSSNNKSFPKLLLLLFIIVLAGKKMSNPGGDWMCGACQHVNFKRRDACQRCGHPKFGGPDPSSYGSINNKTSEALAGDWFCNALNCGAHNYASRPSCFRCGLLKGGSVGYGSGCSFPPGWKPGDWICSRYGCRMHNYASRTECFKCKTPRDYGSAD